MGFMSCADTTNTDPRLCTPGTPGQCHTSATCTQVTPHVCACNPASSYRCRCNHGYVGDGLTCTRELQQWLFTVRTHAEIVNHISSRAEHAISSNVGSVNLLCTLYHLLLSSFVLLLDQELFCRCRYSTYCSFCWGDVFKSLRFRRFKSDRHEI